MWGEVAFAFAPSCFSREAGYIAANHPRPIKQARKSLHQALIQIISPKVLQTSTTILQLKVFISYVVQKLVGHPPQQECPSNLASFVFPFFCNARFLDHQFFLFFFPMNFHIIKQGKRQTPVFENKFRWAWLGGLKGS